MQTTLGRDQWFLNNRSVILEKHLVLEKEMYNPNEIEEWKYIFALYAVVIFEPTLAGSSSKDQIQRSMDSHEPIRVAIKGSVADSTIAPHMQKSRLSATDPRGARKTSVSASPGSRGKKDVKPKFSDRMADLLIPSNHR